MRPAVDAVLFMVLGFFVIMSALAYMGHSGALGR